LYRGRVLKDKSIKIIQLFSFDNVPLFQEEAVAEEEAIDDKVTEKPEQEIDEKKVKEIEIKAYEEGFTSGEKAGFAKGEERAEILLDGLDSLIREMKAIKEQTIKKLEPQILELAITLAKRIVIDELTIQPDILVKIVKKSLKKLSKTGTITIKINTSCYDLFMKKKSELVEMYSDIVFEVEPSLPFTKVLVTGPLEEIVVDIEEMVKNIAEEIKGSNGGN
jgi:flagellar assembly protein FliH